MRTVSPNPPRHPVVVQMVEAVMTVLQSPAFEKAEGDHLGQALLLAVAICDEIHRPHNIYIPSGESVRRSLDLARRNANIQAAFKGRNLDEVAEQYGLSPRHVRRIVK